MSKAELSAGPVAAETADAASTASELSSRTPPTVHLNTNGPRTAPTIRKSVAEGHRLIGYAYRA